MQLHIGVHRNHNEEVFKEYGPDAVSTFDKEIFHSSRFPLLLWIYKGIYMLLSLVTVSIHKTIQGADIPIMANFVDGLKPLLNKFGDNPHLRIIVFTLDESVRRCC